MGLKGRSIMLLLIQGKRMTKHFEKNLIREINNKGKRYTAVIENTTAIITKK
jgi:hypothetical protein